RRYDKAEGHSWAAAALRPTLAVAWSTLGEARRNTRDWAGAEAALREAVRLDPNFAQGHLYLGNFFRVRGTDMVTAEAELREAVRLAPNSAHAREHLGLALLAKKDLDGAEEALNESIRLNPGYYGAHHALGRVLLARGDPSGAEAKFRQVAR